MKVCFINDQEEIIPLPVYTEFYELSIISNIYNSLLWIDHEDGNQKAKIFLNEIVQHLPNELREDTIILKAYSLYPQSI